MSATIAQRLRRIQGVPEDSRRIRIVVAVMVEVAVLAVVAQGAVDAASSVGALVLVPAGYAYSYARRHHPSILAKVALAMGLLVALGSFLRGVEGAQSFDDARRPLASLFLWVQVLHSFDVPRRRDLGFSVISSLILIAEAGALSFGTGFLLFLLPWLALAGTYLFVTLGPGAAGTPAVVEIRRPVAPARRSSWPATIRMLSAWVALSAVAATAMFLALPRLPGLTVALPPFRADHATVLAGFDGQVVNPGLTRGADGVAEFTDLAYPGFSSSVDLRSRGHLSDAIVMRVRSPQAALWRGLAYDTFDGTRWTTSDDRTFPVTQGYEDVFGVASPTDGGSVFLPSRRVLATFYVEADLPNVVFGAWKPVQAYFPSSRLVIDAYGSVRAPILLDDGVVYSVMSDVPAVTPDVLRTFDSMPRDPDLDAALEPYLQLPGELPERVRLLAGRITAVAPTRYDAVEAVQTWLRRNTRYDLDIPPFPPGVDAVDHFLFEGRRGFCEHIASAMAVLLRASGIPARFVTGFGPGDRNPFTGYWEVRASDAHAWVEVFYPGAGWVPYDPTFGVPPASVSLAQRLVAPEVVRAIGRFLSAAVPEPVRDAARASGRAVMAVARAWPLLVAAISLGAIGALLLRRRGARRRRRPPPAGAARAFAELESAMASRGRARAEHQTAAEFLRAARPLLGPDERADAELVVRLFERDRFSGHPANEDDVRLALAASARLSHPSPAGANGRR